MEIDDKPHIAFTYREIIKNGEEFEKNNAIYW